MNLIIEIYKTTILLFRTQQAVAIKVLFTPFQDQNNNKNKTSPCPKVIIIITINNRNNNIELTTE